MKLFIQFIQIVYGSKKRYQCQDCSHIGTGIKGIDIKFIILYVFLSLIGYFIFKSKFIILVPIFLSAIHTHFTKPKCRECFSEKLEVFIPNKEISDER